MNIAPFLPRAGSCVALLLVSVAATTAHAQVAYTDSLGREWRQVVGSTSRSWNEFASACPTDGVTPCNGLVSGLDVSGWIWATEAQVTELFAEFVPEILNNPSLGGPAYVLPAMGFTSTFLPTFEYYTTFGGYNYLTGWTATQVGAMARTASVSARWNPFDSSWDVAALAAVGEANTFRGAWMFRTGPATEPLTYCAPSAPGTSSGCLPQISATGHPDVAHSNVCVIDATGVEGQRSGTIFYGVSGALQSPWCSSGGSSTLCVRAPTVRTAPQASGGASGACDGALTLDWNLFQAAHPTALGNPFSAGDVVNLQGWFRDPTSCRGTSLTEAVQLTYLP
jgi:hypothetical protein